MPLCCKNVFKLCSPLFACADILNIKTPIISDLVTVIFTDKFNNHYSVSKTSDVDGVIEIELTGDNNDLPPALLNEFAGPFRFEIYSGGLEIQYTINGLQYDFIEFRIEKLLPIIDSITIDPYILEGTQGSINLN